MLVAVDGRGGHRLFARVEIVILAHLSLLNSKYSLELKLFTDVILIAIQSHRGGRCLGQGNQCLSGRSKSSDN